MGRGVKAASLAYEYGVYDWLAVVGYYLFWRKLVSKGDFW
jgi:hypothetical protein